MNNSLTIKQWTTKRSALYVSAFFPDEFAPHAGGQAAFQNRRDLELAGYDVTSLICTTECVHGAVSDKFNVVFHQTPIRLLLGYVNNLLSFRALACLAWPVLDTRANIAFERQLKHELINGDYAIVFADFTQVFLPVVRAMDGLKHRPLFCCCVHDLFIQKMFRSDKLLLRMLMGTVVRAERQILHCFDEVITLSDKDYALAKQLYDLKNVSVRPWTPPRWVRDVNRQSGKMKKAEILFFANFDRPENAEAANWLLSSAWPAIKRAVPSATLVFGGAGSERVKFSNNIDGVFRTGFIENPGVLFETCEVAVAPLMHGAGVKFKVLEALACGVEVVGTAVALEGVPRSELTVETTRDKFVDTIVARLKL